jgi:hypothetical protein
LPIYKKNISLLESFDFGKPNFYYMIKKLYLNTHYIDTDTNIQFINITIWT